MRVFHAFGPQLANKKKENKIKKFKIMHFLRVSNYYGNQIKLNRQIQ
jgi:hypothetical protein